MKAMTRQEAARFLTISMSTFKRMEKAGQLPPRIRVSERRFVYLESDIIECLAGKPRGRINGVSMSLQANDNPK